MSSINEHAERWRTHQQPRRVDYHREGFVRPPDPATGVNAGPPSDRDGAGDAPDEAKGVSTPAPVAVYPLTPADPPPARLGRPRNAGAARVRLPPVRRDADRLGDDDDGTQRRE